MKLTYPILNLIVWMVLIALLVSALLLQFVWKRDNIIEQIGEKVIKNELGVEVDFSP